MKTLFNTALVLGSVVALGACAGSSVNTELPTPCGLERTVCYEDTAAVKKVKKIQPRQTRLERTYTAAQSK